MSLDALRVEQPLEEFKLERVSPEEQQAAIDAKFANIGNPNLGPQLVQGEYRYDPSPAPTWESAQEELFREVTLPEYQREKNKQQAENFMRVAGAALEPGEVVADLAGLEDESIERYIVENADIIGGVGALTARGLKRLATSSVGRKLAEQIAKKKMQAGYALDDMSRMLLGPQPEYSLIDGAPARFLDDADPLLSGLDDEALGTAMGVSGVQQLDDLGAFAMGGGGSSYNDLDFEVARTLDAMKHDPQGLFPKLFHQLNGNQQTQVINNYQRWLRKRDARPDLTPSGVQVFGGASTESKNIVALPNPLRAGSSMENIMLTADDAMLTDLGVRSVSAPPAAQLLNLDIWICFQY